MLESSIYNNSYTAFFPLEGSSVEGLLWISHESMNELWLEDGKHQRHLTTAQQRSLLYNQGASILKVSRDVKGVWKMDTQSEYSRRITGLDSAELTASPRHSGGTPCIPGPRHIGQSGWRNYFMGYSTFM
jgi:secreted PhoX family phosphatase